ncbi:hypothetical protein CVIRNUC_009431 [Coccomyxa viridis]|uniref:Hemimethylated DNA-binding domain-containing protein n=1 Tax=Coccomyxa viridis TaxID=1274662 RepID=A0AAV1IFZ7_9CHLO|nr:hypothetical protein CVIRNUC_009431 [Coccomyxa viridis]
MDKLRVFKSGDEDSDGLSVEDYPSQEVAVRVQLQRAIEEERYDEAALLRDSLQQLQQRYQDAAAKSGADLAGSAGQQRFYIGQRVEHRELGYRAVVYGWDSDCCENEKWKASADVPSLQHGEKQTFYHVLVDARDWPADSGDAPVPVAYVAHEKLYAPQWPSTWVSERGPDDFKNLMRSILFLGDDENGDLIPTRALRDRLKQQRRDVFPPPPP